MTVYAGRWMCFPIRNSMIPNAMNWLNWSNCHCWIHSSGQTGLWWLRYGYCWCFAHLRSGLRCFSLKSFLKNCLYLNFRWYGCWSHYRFANSILPCLSVYNVEVPCPDTNKCPEKMRITPAASARVRAMERYPLSGHSPVF